MVALDTNVIVRYIVQDDPLQAKAATRIFEKEITRDNRGFISCIALCETLWVLGRGYKQPKEKLVEVLSTILGIDNLEIEHRDLVRGALGDYRDGKADFSDYLLARIGKDAGACGTYSFDQNAQLHPLFMKP